MTAAPAILSLIRLAQHLTPVGYLLQADWNIVKKGWDAHVLGEAPNKFTDPVEAVTTLRVNLADYAIYACSSG